MDMTKLPKLRIQTDPSEPAVVEDFEQAANLPYNRGLIIAVEGHMVSSFEELKNLLEKHQYWDKEYLNVSLLPIVLGG
jgi:hypothetical protein